MIGKTAWRLLDGAERSLVEQLRMLLDRIDPVPRDVLAAAASLGQRIAVRRPSMCATT